MNNNNTPSPQKQNKNKNRKTKAKTNLPVTKHPTQRNENKVCHVLGRTCTKCTLFCCVLPWWFHHAPCHISHSAASWRPPKPWEQDPSPLCREICSSSLWNAMFLLRRIQCYCTRTCRLWLLSCKHNVVVLFGHVCELILWAGICRLFLFPDFTMVPCRQDVVSFGRVCELILLTGTCIRRLFLFPDFIVTVSVTLLSPPPPPPLFLLPSSAK